MGNGGDRLEIESLKEEQEFVRLSRYSKLGGLGLEE